jgi:cyclase
MRIFNEKEVDEICVLDIGERFGQKGPQFDLIREIASEAFMPLSYGGGIGSLEEAQVILKSGVEKVVVNSLAFSRPHEVARIVAFAGSSSVVVSIDVKRNWLNRYEVLTQSGTKKTGLAVIEAARAAERMGAGEILLNSMDRDGTLQGYDTKLIAEVVNAVSIPVVVCGGAGNLQHLKEALAVGASAAAAGSMFIYQGRHRAVLISYPSSAEIESMEESVLI